MLREAPPLRGLNKATGSARGYLTFVLMTHLANAVESTAIVQKIMVNNKIYSIPTPLNAQYNVGFNSIAAQSELSPFIHGISFLIRDNSELRPHYTFSYLKPEENTGPITSEHFREYRHLLPSFYQSDDAAKITAETLPSNFKIIKRDVTLLSNSESSFAIFVEMYISTERQQIQTKTVEFYIHAFDTIVKLIVNDYSDTNPHELLKNLQEWWLCINKANSLEDSSLSKQNFPRIETVKNGNAILSIPLPDRFQVHNDAALHRMSDILADQKVIPLIALSDPTKPENDKIVIIVSQYIGDENESTHSNDLRTFLRRVQESNQRLMPMHIERMFGIFALPKNNSAPFTYIQGFALANGVPVDVRLFFPNQIAIVQIVKFCEMYCRLLAKLNNH